MLRPTPGEVLEGVRRELAAQVLPELPAGAAARQLRAALHALGRLQRSWDLLPAALEADNADLRAGLAELSARSGLAWQDRTGAPLGTWPGVHDPHLQRLMTDSAQLQADLVDLQAGLRQAGQTPDTEQLLLELHSRRATRARQAGGLPDDVR